MIEIRHRYTNAVIYRSETAKTTLDAVVEAVGARANLAGAYLADANLAGAYLADAIHVPAIPVIAGQPETREPYVRAKTPEERRARDIERAKRYRDRHPEVPVVEALDQRILDVVTGGGGTLDMSHWHTCETTHCRAGWAIHFAGKDGYALESEHGTRIAGAMIYRASTGRSPHFFATNEAALEDIKRCAAEETLRAEA